MAKTALQSMVETQRKINRRAKKKPNVNRVVVYPLATEKMFANYIKESVKFMQNAINNVLISELPSLVDEAKMSRGDSMRVDFYGDRLENLLNIATRRTIQSAIAGVGTREAVRLIAEQVSDFNRRQVKAQLEEGLGVDVLLNEPYLTQELESFSFWSTRLIQDMPDQYRNRVQNIAMAGLQSGESTTSLARKIAKEAGVQKRRAELIARDQVSKLNGQLTQLRQQEAGVKKYRWRTSRDERVRSSHAAREGKVYSWNRPPEGGHPGQPINCLVSGTVVEFPNPAFRGFKRFYKGDIVKITTETNISVSVTPNHPILTTRGWVFAKNLDSSGKLIECFGPEKFGVFDNKINNGATTCDDFFDFLKVVGSNQRVRGSSVQFHGDGVVDEEVEIISSPSRLLGDRLESWDKKIVNNVFPNSNHAQGSLLGQSGLLKFFHSPLSPSGGLMRFSGLVDSLGFSHASPLELFSLGLVSDFYAHFQESSADDVPACLKHFRDFILAHPALVEFFDFNDIQFFAIPRHLFFSSKIKTIDFCKYEGNVYNFETKDNYFLGNQLIVSNCRCTAQPVFED